MKKILSLFSGAGGIDIGFKSNSFETYAAIDNWQVACDTLKENKISKNVICSNNLRVLVVWNPKNQNQIEKKIKQNKNISIIDKIKIKK